MKREIGRLDGGPFDLLVIGGGIYGAWAAYDAALRGLRVALVEQEDWASGTSSASSKLIHGGLRYLRHGRLGLVRKSLDERRRLARLGPHRVRPLTFGIPMIEGGSVGRWALGAGLRLYDLLAGRDQPVEGRKSWKAKEFLRRYPFLNAAELSGGFTYGDCRTDDARLTLEIVWGAVAAGAAAVNRARVASLLKEGARVYGAAVEDVETGRSFEVRATVTLGAAGPWTHRMVERATGMRLPLRHSKGVHVVVPKLPTEDAFLLLPESDGRVVFLIPWYGRTLVGTTETDFAGDPEALSVTREEEAYLLGRAGRVLKEGGWGEGEVIGRFAGLRVLPEIPGVAAGAVPRDWKLLEPFPGFLTMAGGKLSSARADAAEAVDRAELQVTRSVTPCPTAERPLPWAPAEGIEEIARRGIALGLDSETAAACAERYGATAARIHARIDARRDLARRIVPDAPFCRAEVVHAAEEEMARSLADIVRRRMPLALVSPLLGAVLDDVAALAGDALGWSAERRETEIASLGDGSTRRGGGSAPRSP